MTTHESASINPKTIVHSFQQKQQSLLARIILKPPYVSISSSNKISGDFGHSSAIFKKPIIEGLYFL